MSWLRNNSLRNSFGKQWARDSPPKDADPGACYDSFCKHWQQTHDIIKQIRTSPGSIHDDILAVVNHIDQMVTLLLLEFRNNIGINQQQISSTTPSHSPCLEYLLSENLLDLLFDWSTTVGRYNNVIRMKQMKLFEILVDSNGSLLAHEPVARPLLRLLEVCANDILPLSMEEKLIKLLNSLCVALMQNLALLDVFFHPSEKGSRKFLIFALLLPHVHSEGTIGQRTRDAMLLCMALSKKNPQIGCYIAEHSVVCPVLATGISALYSLLPCKLDIETEDWHRLTPDDINDMPALDNLMQSFEFCNAVAQIAHPAVQKELLEYLYQGFLVPVMGPALLQTSTDNLVAATAYFDLFLRSVTDAGLLRTLIKFLLVENYDERRILDVLIQRISSRSRLCIVTLALFETLVDLNCEDIMLELCLSSLTPCSHIMLSQRRRLRDFDGFERTAKKFLSLRPACCLSWTNLLQSDLPPSSSSSSSSHKNSNSKLPQSVNTSTKMTESLYGNYHAYLYDARQKIISCQIGCSTWSSKYDGVDEENEINNDDNTSVKTSSILINNINIKDIFQLINTNIEEKKNNNLSKDDILESIKLLIEGKKVNNSRLESEKPNDVSETLNECDNIDGGTLDHDISIILKEDLGAELSSELIKNCVTDESEVEESLKAIDSLFSIGESSSGYESLALKNLSSFPSTSSDDEFNLNAKIDQVEEKNIKNINANESKVVELNDNQNSDKQEIIKEKKIDDDIIVNGKPNIGNFLDVIFRKLELMTSNNLYVNLQLTGLISRLAIYHQPLLRSFLLNPSLVFQPSIRSLFQILASLKHKIDQCLAKVDNVDELVRQARIFLINREYQLINTRRNAIKSTSQAVIGKKDTVPPNTFVRNEAKRRSLTSSLTQIFKFGTNSPPQSLRLTDETSEVTVNDTNYRQTEPAMVSKITPTQHVVICAVIMDEWLKELSAITQEHIVLSFSSRMIF